MYEAFYGLTSKPFQLNPDPHFYYGSKQHQRAKAYLDYGVSRNDGFIVITGEIGAGKTTMLRSLLDRLVGTNVVPAHLVTTQLDAEDTLRMVAAAFGLRSIDIPKAELLSVLEAFLITHTSQGKRCLLVVDEAQNLTPRAVEELRMLSNYQLGNQALLQTFLVGQPEFRAIIQRSEMEQFRQRVAATCHIGPMDEQETQAYIHHRLKCAGSQGKPEFEAAAFKAIHEASHGIPRRINSLCDRLLLLGFMENKAHLTLHDVNSVLQDFQEETHVPAANPSPRPAGTNGFHDKTAPVVDAEMPAITIKASTADRMTEQLGALGAEQYGDRLQRLERSVLRLERISLETLSTLRDLIKAIRAPANDDAP
jgi:general secretion pathway protein A